MLLKNENQIIRVLKSQGGKALVIDCIKRTMPKWVADDSLSYFDDCGEDEMFERTDYHFGRELTPNEQRIAQERFTMISGILPFIGNEQKRSQMIDFLAEHQSKQTIFFQNVRVAANGFGIKLVTAHFQGENQNITPLLCHLGSRLKNKARFTQGRNCTDTNKLGAV